MINMIHRCNPFVMTIGLCIASLPMSLRAAGPVEAEIDPVFTKHSVFAIGHTSPEFRDRLLKLVGADNVAACQPLLPYTLIIRNANKVAISIVVIRYPKTSSEGESVEGLNIVRTGNSVQPLLNGDEMVITPDSGVSQALYDFRLGRPSPVSLQSAVSRFMPTYNNLFGSRFPQGKVSLDSVVLSDGGVVGPDRLDIISLEQGQVAAENEIIAKFADASRTDAELMDWLTALSQAPAPGGKAMTTAPAQVAMFKRALAKALLTRFNVPRLGGRSSIIPTLKEYQTRRVPPPSSLRKLD